MLQFGVAKELGLSLSEVRATMTPEELIGWSAYFNVINDEQQRKWIKHAAAAKVRKQVRRSSCGFLQR